MQAHEKAENFVYQPPSLLVPYLLGLYAIEKFFTTLKDFIHQDLVYLIPDRKATIATTFFGSKVQKTAGSLSEKKRIFTNN